MDYRIWKYELEIKDSQTIMMPNKAELMSVANQDGKLCLWATVNTHEKLQQRFIDIIGTGNPMLIGLGIRRRFIGTVVIDPFVWHVFERIS